MKIDYTDPTEFVVSELQRSEPGTVFFQSTFEKDQPARLIALAPDHDGDTDPSKVYIKLSEDSFGFKLNSAMLTDVMLGVTGWRIELDPKSVTSTGAGRPTRGDLILHNGSLSLVVWDDRGRPSHLDMVSFVLGSPSGDNRTTTYFRRWRIVKDINTKEEPVVIYERDSE